MTVYDITNGIPSEVTLGERSVKVRQLRALSDLIDQGVPVRDVEVGLDIVNPTEVRMHLTLRIEREIYDGVFSR